VEEVKYSGREAKNILDSQTLKAGKIGNIQ
jgi:hypothetical protein